MNATHRIFCLFNNSRFRRSGLYDFVPENFPLSYCSYVVYWSVSVANASVSSRVERFDTAYGLWKLKETLDNHLLAQRVGVLMALGGYTDDSPHFSRLGRDPSAMGRFVANVMQAISAHHLDGVTIHWAVPHMVCRTTDDALTMSILVDKLREAYWLNGWSSGNITPKKLITAIFPADLHVVNHLANLLMDKLDYAFFETHLFQPTTVRIGCRDVATEVFRFFSSLYSYAGHEEKICAGISLTAWAIDTHGLPELALNASTFAALPGTAAVFEVCNAQELCLDTTGRDCNILKIPISGTNSTGTTITARGTTPTGATVTASAPSVTSTTVATNTSTTVSSQQPIARTFEPIQYMFHTNITLFRVLAHGASAAVASTRNFCVLLYDLDMDNYHSVCPGAGIDRMALQHFHNAVHMPTSDVLRTLMPPC
ncbi:hypothetical protein V5799_017936 [Amblyomma americanum]|uniref:GH18 domain-containing protein n=1 Tax=Amblyomma americanum TaxID=6943 RepID=A0AAQ4F1R8_AMBAM